MKKIKVSEASGAALDWLVAKAEGWADRGYMSLDAIARNTLAFADNPYNPSTDWEQGGPIIEREKLNTEWSALWKSWLCPDKRNGGATSYMGDTPLIAAMRCYVASKLGDEVEVPEEVWG